MCPWYQRLYTSKLISSLLLRITESMNVLKICFGFIFRATRYCTVQLVRHMLLMISLAFYVTSIQFTKLWVAANTGKISFGDQVVTDCSGF